MCSERFERANTPLFGIQILNTAEKRSAEKLRKSLINLGATIYDLPCIRVVQRQNFDEVLQEASHLSANDWILITSRNGADSFIKSVPDQGDSYSDRKFLKPKIAVVGPATAQLLREAGINVDLAPKKATSNYLFEELAQLGVKERRFLLIQGNLVDDSLKKNLEEQGGQVSKIITYDTLEEPENPMETVEVVRSGVDLITLMSSSAVRSLAGTLGVKLFKTQRFVCIGPSTADQVRALDAIPRQVANPHTVAGLVQAVLEEAKKVKKL